MKYIYGSSMAVPCHGQYGTMLRSILDILPSVLVIRLLFKVILIKRHFLFSMMIENSAADVASVAPPTSGMSSMSEIPVSPTSVASSGHFPFSAPDISGMGVDTSALDTAFTSDVASSVGLQLGPDGGAGNSRDSLRSLDQIHWSFSLSDLTADLSNLGDLGALGNYPGSPFLPSDSEILLDSPEQEDIVEEFFVDSVPGPPGSQSDEERP
ncbi:hypothetical protein Tsubulata_026375 [Turnera subulata]|uniref:Uncharacterized protein n=1 Tax=Turnera subulata TaxID=218843 RepID=A0A9Q0JD78_9ROSI|nr:hypothetical protein Tsubulata_026375 [Turnera subulata]